MDDNAYFIDIAPYYHYSLIPIYKERPPPLESRRLSRFIIYQA